MTYQYRKKISKGVVCGDTGVKLNGIPQCKSKELRRIGRHHRSVTRPYGGSRTADAVKSRILRSFLLEELKELKNLKATKEQKKKGKQKENKAKK